MFVVKHRNNRQQLLNILKSEDAYTLSPELVAMVCEGPSRPVFMHLQAYRHFYKNGITPTYCSAACLSPTFILPLTAG